MTSQIQRETALASVYLERGLATTLVGGFLVPPDFGSGESESAALRNGAGIVDVSYLYKLDVQGGNALSANGNRSDIDRWRISERHALYTATSIFTLSDANLTIIDVTDQSACFALAGPRSRDVLSRLAPIDLRDSMLPVSGCAATLAAGIHTLVGRAANALYLFVPRDAALSFWEAVQHSGAIPCGELAWMEFRL